MARNRKPKDDRQPSHVGGDGELSRYANDRPNTRPSNAFGPSSTRPSSGAFGHCPAINPFFDPNRVTHQQPSCSAQKPHNYDCKVSQPPTHHPSRIISPSPPRNHHPHNIDYAQAIRDIFSEGTVLQQRMDELLAGLEQLLSKRLVDEMEWESVSTTYLVPSALKKEGW